MIDPLPRLVSGVAVSALVRRIEAEGGGAMVLAKGDPTAGALLLVLADRGRTFGVRERLLDPQGRYRWAEAGPTDPAEFDAFIVRRRRSDPDLWVVELDHPNAEGIATELLG